MGDFPFLDHLTLKYAEKVEEAKHWTCFLKAHGLANACLARDSTREDIKEKIYELEQKWYDGKHPQSYSEHQEMIGYHKTQLRNLRCKTDNRLSRLDPMQAEFNTKIIFSRENILRLLNFANEVFEMSQMCTASLIEFSSLIIRSSMDLLEEPPCPFAVIGLGSIARGEATPFSDLEYGFLVEPGFSNHRYFTDLAVDSYFRIGNLGESPLKVFDIKELSERDNEGAKLFVDQPPVSGFKIDGISSKAGNIPTGHGTEDGKKLILTVEELMTLYASSLMDPADPDVPGDMSDLLSSPVLILGHKGGEKILDQYMAKRKVYEESVAVNCPQAIWKRVGTLVSDIKSYSFLPKFTVGNEPNNLGFGMQVKADIFRYPTLLATNLRIISNFDSQHPWDTFESFYNDGALSVTNYAYMRIVLGLSIFIRTKAYSVIGSQHELLSLQPTAQMSQALPHDMYHVPQNVFLSLGSLLIPIKSCIEKSIAKARRSNINVGRYNMPGIIRKMLSDFQISENDFILKAEVLHYMRNFDAALTALTDAVGNETVNSYANFTQAVSKAYEVPRHDPLMEKALNIAASLMFYFNRYEAALDYYTWFSFNSVSDTERVTWNINSARLFQKLDQFKRAKTILKQTEQILRMIPSVDSSLSLHEYIIGQLETPGIDKRNLDNAIAISFYGHELYTCFAQTNLGLNLHQQALSDAKRAEQILHALEARGQDVKFRMGYVYNVEGRIQFTMEKLDESLDSYQKALIILKSLYGCQAAHTHIATSYINISEIYLVMGKSAEALEMKLRVLGIHEIIYSRKHYRWTTLQTIRVIGFIHTLQGNYTEGLKRYQQVIDIHKNLKYVSFDDIIHDTYLNLTSAYQGMGDYSTASKFLSTEEICSESNTTRTMTMISCFDMNLYAKILTSTLEGVEDDSKDKLRSDEGAVLYIGQSCLNLSKHAQAYLKDFSALLARTGKKSLIHQEVLLALSKTWMCLKHYNTAILLSTVVLKSNGETPKHALGEVHYIIGHSYMQLEMYRKSWSHLHSALCIYQNLPKYRSFVLHLAKVHLSISTLLFKLCRVLESYQHAVKAVHMTDELISDEDITTAECLDVSRQAKTLRDTLVLLKV